MGSVRNDPSLGQIVDRESPRCRRTRRCEPEPYHGSHFVVRSVHNRQTAGRSLRSYSYRAEPVPGRKFEAIMNAITQSIRRGTVLLHCAEGVSRAPSLTAAYLHRVGYKQIDAALAEIKRLRPIANPSKTLFESVKEHLR
jgi:protein-tyrosine phosphatase